MKNQHTEGEWMIAENGIDDKHKYTILSNGSKAICDVYRHNWPKKKRSKDSGAKANAKLIAAAPTMLKALQGFIHHDDNVKKAFKASPSLRTQIKDAIKEATEV